MDRRRAAGDLGADIRISRLPRVSPDAGEFEAAEGVEERPDDANPSSIPRFETDDGAAQQKRDFCSPSWGTTTCHHRNLGPAGRAALGAGTDEAPTHDA